MDSVPGQTFLNYAYSWGASIVILGALFKLTHLPGGNLMLFIGMGTETIVFFLSAFDRPFDKSEEGKELPNEMESDEQIAARLEREGYDEEDYDEEYADSDDDETAVEGGSVVAGGETAAPGGKSRPAHGGASAGRAGQGGGYVAGGSTIIIGGGASVPEGASAAAPDPVVTAQQQTAAALAELTATPEGEATMDAEAKRLAEIIRLANDELLRRAQAVLSPEMEAATQTYIEKLQCLNDTLAKVDEQSARLTRDSQEMENLNRTLIGINKIYDLHFASISKQVTTIEQINEQTRELAKKIEEVNAIYARMMQTLSLMSNPGGAAPAPEA